MGTKMASNELANTTQWSYLMTAIPFLSCVCASRKVGGVVRVGVGMGEGGSEGVVVGVERVGGGGRGWVVKERGERKW